MKYVILAIMWPAWILMGIPVFALARVWCADFPETTLAEAKEGFFK